MGIQTTKGLEGSALQELNKEEFYDIHIVTFYINSLNGNGN